MIGLRYLRFVKKKVVLKGNFARSTHISVRENGLVFVLYKCVHYDSGLT